MVSIPNFSFFLKQGEAFAMYKAVEREEIHIDIYHFVHDTLMDNIL
jgi:hypothetical protein